MIIRQAEMTHTLNRLRRFWLASLILCIISGVSKATVNLKPSKSSLRHYNGGQVVVVCEVTPGETSARWLSPSHAEISDDSNQRVHIERKNGRVVLRIKGVRSEDRGTWSCDAGIHGKESFNLDVEDKLVLQANNVEYAPLGDTHFISCLATGTDKAELSWRKGPHKQKLSSSKYRVNPDGLHIISVSMADNDTFWCTADMYDKGITFDHPIRIIVSKAVTQPHITCVGDPCAVQGGRAVLQCDSSGLPQPKYQWSKGPTLRIQSNPDFKYHTDGNSLVINKLNKSDDGKYECRAFNEFDTRGKSAEFTVDVFVPPQIYQISPLSISNDESADLICAVDPSSSTPLTFQWLHQNGTSIRQNNHLQVIEDPTNFRSVLRILNVNKNHFKNYTCEVKNIAGVRRSQGELRVNIPCAPTDNNKTTIFYGLEGLETHIRCTFDCFPTPSIAWHFSHPPLQKMKIGERGVRGISMSQTGPYSWTSFLKIVPIGLNTEATFYCAAYNSRQSDPSIARVILRKATSPEPPGFGQKVNTFVNTASFKASLPLNTGGLPIKHIEVRYKPVPHDRQNLEPPYLSERYNVSRDDKFILVTLGNLLPSTLYRIGLVSVTEVGPSRMVENLFRTSGRTHPIFEVGVAASGNTSHPLIVANTSYDVIPCGLFSSCWIMWRLLSDGGSPVTSISINHIRVRTAALDPKSGQTAATVPITETSHELKRLLPLSRYLIEFKSSNKIGSGTKKFFVKTGASPPGYKELQEARKRPSVWAVIGIILLILTLLIFLCMFVVCLRMPKPSSSGNHFMGKIAGVSSPNPPFFDNDFRESMQPLNADSSRNCNPLYKENTTFDSPWNTFVSESRTDKQSRPMAPQSSTFRSNTDSSRV